MDFQIWRLFPNKKIIDICVENPQLKLQITDSLNNVKGLQDYLNPPYPLERIGGNEVDPIDEWVVVVGGSSN
ncbi:hypothetical protein [Rickettsia endosymbiont of Polydrusus tereticollis]|uniref:hypothetical protein n=1 Tax=Rickettsia endosymbiont of Polydrusus tereticollis TaxID=3066251 RepID=UPI003132C91C